MRAAVWNTYLKPRCWIASAAPPPLIMMTLCFSATAEPVAAVAEPSDEITRLTLSSVISFSIEPGGGGRIGTVVIDDEFDRMARQSAAGVGLFAPEVEALEIGRREIGEIAGLRKRHADPDRVGGVCGKPQR